MIGLRVFLLRTQLLSLSDVRVGRAFLLAAFDHVEWALLPAALNSIPETQWRHGHPRPCGNGNPVLFIDPSPWPGVGVALLTKGRSPLCPHRGRRVGARLHGPKPLVRTPCAVSRLSSSVLAKAARSSTGRAGCPTFFALDFLAPINTRGAPCFAHFAKRGSSESQSMLSSRYLFGKSFRHGSDFMADFIAIYWLHSRFR